jgi:chromosome segregation ATPase
MIKMKELLSLKEDVDKDIKKNIDEIGKLDREIDDLQKKLKPLRNRYGELVDNVLPMLNKLGKEQYKTNNYILRIIRKGYERQSFQYKEGFNRALDKVNKNMKRILEQILDDTKKMVKVSPSFQVKPVEIREISFKDWVKKYTRKVVRKIIPYMKVIVKTNNDLRKMI